MLKGDGVCQLGPSTPYLSNFEHIPRKIDPMHASAKGLRHHERRAAKATPNIEHVHTRPECDQSQDLARGGFAAWADKIAAVDRLVLTDFVHRVLARVERVTRCLGHQAFLISKQLT